MDLADAAAALGVTHVVWIPDSELGRAAARLEGDPRFALLEVAREGEAWGVALGLYAAGACALVVMQCTGLFESGDSLRNAVLDYGAPLWALVGVRSAALSATADTCPALVLPFLGAFGISHGWVEPGNLAGFVAAAWAHRRAGRAYVGLLPEGRP